MNRRWLMVLLVQSGLLVLLPAAISPAQERSNVLRTVERIRSEERRQVGVRRQLGSAVRRIDRLLADLESNQLTEQGNGEAIGQVSTGLAKVGKTRVPTAAGYLQNARTNIEDAYPHLDKAETEILAIVADLEQLLKATESALVGDVLLRRIRAIIKTEEFLRRETAKWGKVMILTPKVGDIDKQRVARAQQEVVRQLDGFGRLLSGAAKDATIWSLKRRFTAARNVMQKSRPDFLLKNSVSAILEKDAFAAVEHQDKALEALKEIERILADEEEEIAAMLDLIEKLKRILKEQIELKERVEEIEATAKEQQSVARADQMELRKDLHNAMAYEPPYESAKAAGAAMQQAAGELGEGKIKEAAGHQQTAIDELKKLIAQLEAEMVAAAEAAAEAAAAEAAAMDSQMSSDMMSSDMMSSDMYSDMMPSDMMSSDMMGDMGGDMPGDMGGMMPGAGMGTMPGMGPPGPPGDLPDNPPVNSSGSSSTTVRGKKVERSRMSINALQRRQRAAAIQKYVQQFPPEFRKQVADYYEVLAD